MGGRDKDKKIFNLTVDDLLAAQFGDAGPDLVILSACETGLPDISNNDELIGLPVAFMQAGAHGVVSAMWPVREDATALLMARFHELRLTDMPASLSLWNAQKWLRTSSTKELLAYLYIHMVGAGNDARLSQSFDKMLSQLEDYPEDEKPYADPYFWSGFTFTGVDVVTASTSLN